MGARKDKAGLSTWLDLLDQDRWWKTGSGELVALSKMTLEHKLALMASLLRNAKSYAWENQKAALRASLSVGPDPSDGVFSAMCGWEGEADAAMADPKRWIRSKPLWARLVLLTYQEIAS